MPDLLDSRVDALYIYPIKSCAAVPVDALQVNQAGLIAGDREWAVIDEKDEVTWQGAHPRLARIRPRLTADRLSIEADGEAGVALAAGGQARTVRMWNDSLRAVETFGAFDAGDEAAALLQRVTGAPLRLVRFGPEALARHGLNALHLISTASLDELEPTVAALRFRPNLVLGGSDEPLMPFIEEQVTHVHGDGWCMTVTLPCVRCVVPGVHPQTGEVDDTIPPAVAASSAQRFPGEPSRFGIYAAPTPGCRIAVGQLVGLELGF